MAAKPVSYLQTDPRWKNIDYSAPGEKSTIGNAGCGPTCAAMIVATLADKKVTPVEASAWSKANGYKAANQGTYYSFFQPYGKKYGLSWEQINWSNLRGLSAAAAKPYHDKAINAIKNGHYVIACMGPGNWTTMGHFILWYGVSGDEALINDPASTAAKRVRNKVSLLQKEVKYYFVCNVPEGDRELLTTMKVQVDGGEIKTIKSVLKDEANYPNLRELMGVLGFKVGYDANMKVVKIERE